MLSLKDWQNNAAEFKNAGVELPEFDVEKIKENGKNAPVWIHFGGGNLYRGFHSEIGQRLANAGKMNAGIVVCETLGDEIVRDVYQPFHNDFLEVVMHGDGTLDKRVIAVTADSLFANPVNKAGIAKAVEYFRNPALQFTTFSITEKGYAVKDSKGNLSEAAEQDIKNPPEQAQLTMGIVANLLHQRYQAGAYPIAMVSTDNFSQNGLRFQESILTIAEGWVKGGKAEPGFVDYLQDPQKVSFPWSMIDRITPNPSESVEKVLEKDGFTDVKIYHSARGSNFAAFSNTEEVHYLVIEDRFPNGRPPLDEAGVILTDRETVDKADTMKVTTCLNPLHTALAVAGCLLDYHAISAEMKDADLVGLIKGIGYQEGLPVVSDPGIIDPKQFIDELLTKRLPNPYIPDTPQRIASDTSQKVGIRYGETIKKYVAASDKKATDLTFIPLAIATWLRYLLAVDDQGKPFTPSPDPLLSELQAQLTAIKLGTQDPAKIHEAVRGILSNQMIFGSDLYQDGLGEKIEGLLQEMLAGAGAVRRTIHKYVAK